MATDYRFLPWVRRGLPRAHTTANGAALTARPELSVGLTVQASSGGGAAAPIADTVKLKLFGPADVIGIDTRLILRTDPRPFATNFEPNYLALVDFDPPDFPWLFTPAAPDGDRLRPWLVLLVLERRKVRLPVMEAGVPLPTITIASEHTDSELPDLADSWLWAHAQATPAPGTDPASVNALLADARRNASRIFSPRRLKPGTDYFAALVPAFDRGRDAGLGEFMPPDSDGPLALGPAWTKPAPGAVKLPVYFHWEFSTGPLGDFETLARRIRTPAHYQSDAALMARLGALGTATMAVDGDRLLTASGTPKVLLYEGAITSLSFVSAPGDAEIAARLEAAVNAPQNLLEAAPDPAQRAPTVAPPIYGAFHAKRHRIDDVNMTVRWLDELNVDARRRAAAGVAAEFERQHQEIFMQAAWTQLGDVLAAESSFARWALARDVLIALQKKLVRLPEARLFSLLGPARARIRFDATLTLFGKAAATSFPEAVADAAMRRLTSPQRPLLKAALRRDGVAANPQFRLSTQFAGLVTSLANASRVPGRIDPHFGYVPDGILGTRVFDGLRLPTRPEALVDLTAVGLSGTMRAGEIAQIRSTTAATQKLAGRNFVPALGAVRRTGLLSEVHLARFDLLSAALGVSLPYAQLSSLLGRASTRGAEGVLVGASGESGDYRFTLMPLRIDARSGSIHSFAAAQRMALRAGVPRIESPRRALRLGSVGAVSISGVRQYGNDAVFATLPADTLPLTPVTATARIGVEPGGLFTRTAGPRLPAGSHSVTLPPPLRDRATLKRYSAAFAGYRKLWLDPVASAGLKVTAVDFPLTAASVQLRARTDPRLTIGALMASQLSIGGAPLSFDPSSKALSSPLAGVKLAAVADSPLRFVFTSLFDRVMAYPKLVEPVANRLAASNKAMFMPGAEDIPNDFLLLAKTNNRFVESFLVGLNTEMNRELLWRGYPTDQRGTPFRHFWDRIDDEPDIAPIHLWSSFARLGRQTGTSGADWLVLLIRATLLKRFPNTIIYARRKHATQNRLADPGPGETMDDIVRHPEFLGLIPPDISYVGFAIDPKPAEAAKWCFVLEEQMTEPRLGFDENEAPPAVASIANWKDAAWSMVTPPGNPGNFLRLSWLRRVLPLANDPVRGVPANGHAAHVARALLQRPFRAYWLGSTLVT